MSALGILTFYRNLLWFGSMKNAVLELPVPHQKCCGYGQNTARCKHVWLIQMSSEYIEKLILEWQGLLLVPYMLDHR